MKKLLMTLLLIILLVITCFLILKNISIVGWTSKGIKDIKQASKQLKEQINIAEQKNEQEYPQTVEKLEETIKKYEETKEKYENKISNISEDVELGVLNIKRYKIETLWITLENYAKEANIELLLDVVKNNVNEDSYNLEIAVVGEYINIVDFLYDIEKDEELNFKIENFEMHQYEEKITTDDGEEKILYDPTRVEATFVVNNIEIDNVNGEFN